MSSADSVSKTFLSIYFNGGQHSALLISWQGQLKLRHFREHVLRVPEHVVKWANTLCASCLGDACMGRVQFALLRELTNAGIHKAAVSSAQHSMRLREARYASGNIRECIVKSQAIAAEVAQ